MSMSMEVIFIIFSKKYLLIEEKCASSAVQGMVEVVGGDHDGCFVNKRAVHVPTDDEILIFQGITEGFIVEEPRQHSTRPVFAWDPIFQPVEQECAVPQTFAEMDPNFKNKISHRRKGLDLLLAHFTNLQK